MDTNKNKRSSYKITSLKQKNSKDYSYYKEKADELRRHHDEEIYSRAKEDELTRYESMKLNFDLFSGNVDMKSLAKACRRLSTLKKFRGVIGNRDIVSAKLKLS